MRPKIIGMAAPAFLDSLMEKYDVPPLIEAHGNEDVEEQVKRGANDPQSP